MKYIVITYNNLLKTYRIIPIRDLLKYDRGLGNYFSEMCFIKTHLQDLTS
jgi:hypothetical protein